MLAQTSFKMQIVTFEKTRDLVQRSGRFAFQLRTVLPRGIFLGWLLAVVLTWMLAGVIASGLLGKRAEGHPSNAVAVLSQWDGEHYSKIAAEGYHTEGIERREFNFFPAFPAIARLFGGREHPRLAGIIFNQLLFLVSLALITDLAGSAPKRPLREQPAFWLLVSPFSFFFFVCYTESLFLALTLGMLVAYRHDRTILAPALGFVVGLTRPTSIVVPALFVYEVVRRWRRGEPWHAAAACMVAPIAGFAAYVICVGFLVGDPLGYVHIEQKWWRTPFAFPYQPMREHAIHWAYSFFRRGIIGPPDQLLGFFSGASVLALLIWGWRRLDRNMLLYVVASLLLIHTQTSGTGRFEVVLFPIFLLAAQSVIARPRFAPVVAALLIILQAAGLIRFGLRYWVA